METLYHQKYNLCENAAAHGEEFSLIRLLRSHSILAKRVPLAFGNVRKGACAVAQTFLKKKISDLIFVGKGWFAYDLHPHFPGLSNSGLNA